MINGNKMGHKLLINDEGRECEKCKKYKLWEDFSKNRTNKTGYQSRCKVCSSVNGHKYVKRGIRDFKHEAGFSMKIQQFCLGLTNIGSSK